MSDKKYRIGIDLNDTLRDLTGQMEYVCNKYKKYGKSEDEKYSLERDPITKFDFVKYFDFESKLELNRFLYENASLEVFGHADLTYNGIMGRFNAFLMDIEDNSNHEVILVGREANVSIPSTYFFLSKTICKIKNIKFYHEYENLWDDVDVLITANPTALESRPDDKVSIKVETTYNKEFEANVTLPNLDEFIDDSMSWIDILKNV